MPHVDIVIDDNGDGFTIEGHGFDGKGCSKHIDKIAKAMDSKVASRKKTADYYKQPRLQQRNTQGGGQ